jgi:hypothetical protein
VLAQQCSVPTPKNIFANIKKFQSFGKITFYIEKLEKE